MKKSIISLFFATTMVVSMLAGCGSEKQQEESKASVEGSAQSETKKQESSTTPEIKEDPVTVTWLTPGNEPVDAEMVMEDLNKKLVEAINVELNLVFVPEGEYNDRTRLASTSGEDYDIVFTANWMNSFDENMTRGAFLELNDLLDEYGQDIVAGMHDALWDVSTVNGGIYAIPNQSLFAQQRCLYIQKEYADKYGWTKTSIDELEELEEFLKTVLENEKDVFGIAGHIGLLYNNLTTLVYADIDDATGKVTVYCGEGAELQEDMELHNKWAQMGFFHPELTTGGDMLTLRHANKFVVFPAFAEPYGEVNVSKSQGKEYIMVTYKDPFISTVSGKAYMLGINVNSKHPEAAVKLLNALWSDEELYNELMYGLEGVHYKKVGDQRVELLEGNTGWYLRPTDVFYCNRFLRWKIPKEQDDLWELCYELIKSAKVSYLRGFTADLSNLQVEMAQISAVKGEYTNFYFKENWEELREEYRKKLEAAGMDTVIAELQRQVDEWLAANK